MSKSATQQYQTVDAPETTELRANDIALSTAGRALRDLVGIDTRDGQELPPTYAERAQIVGLSYSATAHACNPVEVQD